jgi:hypothetical protein
VRVLIRRPHAYSFVQRYLPPEPTSTAQSPSASDGRTAPIPGIVFLDSNGALRAHVKLDEEGAREALLRALAELRTD